MRKRFALIFSDLMVSIGLHNNTIFLARYVYMGDRCTLRLSAAWLFSEITFKNGAQQVCGFQIFCS